SVLRMALPSSGALEGARSITEYRATGRVPDRLTPQRTQALERIGERQGLVSELAIIGGVSDSVIRGLVKAGAIEAVEVQIDDPWPEPDPDHAPPELGEARGTVGAPSALFLPYRDLGLIVVDEAHEASFKQEDGVQYHARDVAVMRAMFEEIPVVLASATPAIETRHMAEIGTYRELKLPARYGGAQLPDMPALDLLQDPPERGRWLAPR